MKVYTVMTNDNLEESLPTPEATTEPAAVLAPDPVVESTPEPAPEPIVAPERAPEPAPEPIAAPIAAPEPIAQLAPKSIAEEPSEPSESLESFADMLSAFERSHSHKGAPGQRQLQGVVVSLSAEQ